MQFTKVHGILLGAVLTAVSCATLHAQNATVISDREACTVVLSYLSSGFVREYARIAQDYYPGPHGWNDIIGGEPTPSGIRFRLKGKRKQEVSLDYKDFSGVEVNENTIRFKFLTQEKHYLDIDFWTLGTFRVKVQGVVDDRLVQALNKFISDARAGYPYDCHNALTPAESAKELADFQQKAAAWRALNPKPPVSDEVTKKRLLAEDAVEQKNFDAAAGYYRAGVTLDPTWAPGWFNAALINAELKNYADAAFDMKHYLILVPDAPDAAAAKEKVLLWEAKAEQAGGK